MSSFAERLKSLRKSENLTQRELAEAAGVSERGIQNYEAGLRKPTYDVLLSLAKCLNVSLDTLLDNTVAFLPGLEDPEDIDSLAKEQVAPLGEWHVPKDEEDESAGDLNEYNALVYTAHIRKFIRDMGISDELERDFESYVAYLRYRSHSDEK